MQKPTLLVMSVGVDQEDCAMGRNVTKSIHASVFISFLTLGVGQAADK
jgi:hypothetical protein